MKVIKTETFSIDFPSKWIDQIWIILFFLLSSDYQIYFHIYFYNDWFMEVKSTNLHTFFEKEFLDMTHNFEAKSILRNWILLDVQMKEKKNLQNIRSFLQLVKPILLAFPSLYKVESDFNHVLYLLSKQNVMIGGSNSQTCNLIFVISSVPTKPIQLIRKQFKN